MCFVWGAQHEWMMYAHSWNCTINFIDQEQSISQGDEDDGDEDDDNNLDLFY